MAQLIHPTVRVRGSFVAAMDEFRCEGRGDVQDQTMIGKEIRQFGGSWSTTDGFLSYVQWLLAQAEEDSPRPQGHVPSTTLWYLPKSDRTQRRSI